MRNKGFTVLELLIVTVIVGVLTTIAFLMFDAQRNRGHDADTQSHVRGAAVSTEFFYASTLRLPGNWAEAQQNLNQSTRIALSAMRGDNRSGTVQVCIFHNENDYIVVGHNSAFPNRYWYTKDTIYERLFFEEEDMDVDGALTREQMVLLIHRHLRTSDLSDVTVAASHAGHCGLDLTDYSELSIDAISGVAQRCHGNMTPNSTLTETLRVDLSALALREPTTLQVRVPRW